VSHDIVFMNRGLLVREVNRDLLVLPDSRWMCQLISHIPSTQYTLFCYKHWHQYANLFFVHLNDRVCQDLWVLLVSLERLVSR